MTDCASSLDVPPGGSVSQSSPRKGRAARGPFRPEVWLNTRQRSSVRLAAHYFRAADALAVCSLAIFAVWPLAPAGLGSVTLADIAPTMVAAGVLLGLTRSVGLYRFGRDQTPPAHLGALIAIAAAAGAAGLGAGLLANGGLGAAARFLASATATLVILHGAWLAVVARWRRQGALSPNIVIVGATRHAEALIRRALERRELHVLGVFDDRLARSPDSIVGVPVLGDADALMSHHITPYVDHIVLAIDAQAGQRVRDLTRRLEALPNALTVLVETDRPDAALNRLAAAPLARLDRPDPDRKAFHKRILDLILGLLALLAAAPVMALVALAIRLDSPGPIFFRQRRHGFNQEAIVVWKFRSMRHAEADAAASRQVSAGDDRVTRVGRFIRATSLDELPQIFNVLTGEMSLVGPRPHAIGMKTGETESARLVAEYAHRHRIKPGMTGWAAVKGSRGPVNTAEAVRRRVQLDVDYIERQSFWLDLWIVLITVPVLLGDRAAVR